ncbi:MAG: hypothetical protein HY321_02190 [Armatimonadetes bacterium]|nr:hypothetical protein [Armatimonadota bacterium]
MPIDPSSRTTRFSDVCGSLDEIKRLLREEKDVDPAVVRGLLDDVRHMLGRMEQRLEAYTRFHEAAEALLAQMRAVGPSNRERALAAAAEMEARVREGCPATPEGVEALCALAEQVRDVANPFERKLRQSKDAAIALYRLYLDVRGGRDWSQQEGAAPEAPSQDAGALAERLDPWLPPPPHRDHILTWLLRGRAHLHPAPEGQAPTVEFEDGGIMPLPAVRWSDGVRNFYPEGQEPHPGGRSYRPPE